MYQKVSTNLNFVDREKKTEQLWKEKHIYDTYLCKYDYCDLLSSDYR